MRTQTLRLAIISLLLSSCARMPSQHPTTVSMVSPPNTTNKTALRLYEKLPTYVNASKIAWPPIEIQTPLKKGSSNVKIPEIRTRLIALHDMPPSTELANISYDAALARGISQFQAQNDLPQTGILNESTLNALNIKPSERFYDLVQAMNAWAQYPEDASSRYILVNIPSYSMQLIQQGHPVLQMKVIVGRPSRPTPTLRSQITTIVFNPSWNVPETILAQDVIPGMRDNPLYMKEHYDMRIYASWDKNAAEISPSSIDWQTASISNFKYRVTAPPGDKNPLGRVKFIFANDHDVYMHDTPEKGVFALTDRDRSSGCVRLEDPMALVRYFYADNTDLNEPLVAQYLSSYETKHIALRNPMPVYIAYILVSVDDNDHLHFWRNVYGK